MAAAEIEHLRLHVAELEAKIAHLQQDDDARSRYYRTILESAVDFAIIATSRDGRVTDWNTGAELILGWSAEEMRGEAAERIFTPEDRAENRPATEMRCALEAGHANDERWHLKKDGSRFWASGEMMPLRSKAGAHLGFLKIMRDRTEQRRAETALREAQRFNTLILKSSKDCIVVLDLEGNTRFISPGGIDSMEISEVDAVLGLSWLRIWQGADHEAARVAVAEASAGRIGRFQGFCPTHRGTPKWWDIVISPLLDSDSRPEQLVSVGRDITESVQAQERLDFSEQSLRLSTEAAEIGTWDLDLRTNTLISSDRTKAMFGISRNLPFSMDDFYTGLHPDDREATRQAFAAALDPAQRVTYDVKYRTIGKEDGVIRWIAAKGRAIFEADGQCVRALGTAIDITAQKQAEAALGKARADAALLGAEHAAILGQLAEGVIVTDADGHITFVNEAAKRLHGDGVAVLDVAPADYADTYHLFHEDGSPYPSEALPLSRAVLRGESVIDARWRIRRPDGSEVLAVGSAKPVPDATGQQIGSVLTLRDDTARHNAERALRRLNETLEAQVDIRTHERDLLWRNSQDLLVVIDMQGTFRAVSPVVAKILGWTPEEVLGRTVFEFIHPEDQTSSIDALAHATEKELPIFENRYRHRDGTYRWLSWVAAPKGDLIYATARHITAEKQQAEAFARSEARLRTIFETSYQLQGLLALDGRLIDANATSLAVIDAKLEDVTGKPFWDTPWFVGTAGVPEAVRAAVEAAAKGQITRAELSISVASGLRTYDFSVRPIRDERGTVIALGSEAVDITERRHTEEQLRQSQKMQAIGQLTGGIAHDFNNLLTGISGSLELLQARVAQGRIKDLDRYVNAAQGAASRAAALTHRLLAFSRRQTLDPKPTSVNRLVADMEELIQRTVGPAIKVEVVLAGGLWPTLCDPNQLENALLNLCINARDAMPDGGRLTVETGNKWLDERAARERDLSPGQYVTLCASDTGTGMAPEVVARAFDPFFTTKPLGMGTGLGLSMIYGFVKQSGGQVRIYSELGHGTMVCLYLPRHWGEINDSGGQSELAEAPRAEAGETVLVVDDEPTVRMLVTEVLEDLGYTAIEAADGASGLRVLQSNTRIDLLVTDVGLPGGMNGRQVADAARQMRPNLKVLFITGYAENAVITHGHLDPGMHVLTKPFAMEALASRIKDLITTA